MSSVAKSRIIETLRWGAKEAIDIYYGTPCFIPARDMMRLLGVPSDSQERRFLYNALDKTEMRVNYKSANSSGGRSVGITAKGIQHIIDKVPAGPFVKFLKNEVIPRLDASDDNDSNALSDACEELVQLKKDTSSNPFPDVAMIEADVPNPFPEATRIEADAKQIAQVMHGTHPMVLSCSQSIQAWSADMKKGTVRNLDSVLRVNGSTPEAVRLVCLLLKQRGFTTSLDGDSIRLQRVVL